MEGVSTSGLRGYLRRRGYEKLSGSGRRHKNGSSIREVRSARKRRIRIKMAPKLSFLFLRRIRIPSPKNLLVWLRDAYVKLMIGFANSRVCSTGYGGAVDYGTGYFSKGALKEYDEKLIVEIYKSLMLAQGQLIASDSAKLASEIVPRR